MDARQNFSGKKLKRNFTAGLSAAESAAGLENAPIVVEMDSI